MPGIPLLHIGVVPAEVGLTVPTGMAVAGVGGVVTAAGASVPGVAVGESVTVEVGIVPAEVGLAVPTGMAVVGVGGVVAAAGASVSGVTVGGSVTVGVGVGTMSTRSGWCQGGGRQGRR